MKERLKKFKVWRNLRKARKAAKRYGLDFTVKCVFDYQLRNYGLVKHNSICQVKMESGKTGLYLAKITKHWPGNTGQKDWSFEFQGYKC